MTDHVDAGGRAARSALLDLQSVRQHLSEAIRLLAECGTWNRADRIHEFNPETYREIESQVRIARQGLDGIELEAAGLAAGDRVAVGARPAPQEPEPRHDEWLADFDPPAEWGNASEPPAIDPKAIEELRVALVAGCQWLSDKANARQLAWGVPESETEKLIHRCVGALRTGWSILCELADRALPVSSPAPAMPLQHTDLFQVGVMLGYLARTMRNSYQRRVSVPVSHRGDNSGGFDRFTVEDAELASAELLDRYAPDRVARAPVLPEPPHKEQESEAIAEEFITFLDTHARRSPDGDGPEGVSMQQSASANQKGAYNTQKGASGTRSSLTSSPEQHEGSGGKPLTVNAGDGRSATAQTKTPRLAVQGAGSEPADAHTTSSSLPAVLGTLPRYRLFQFVTDCWECPDGEWVKFDDVSRIVSALQHEIAQLKRKI